MASSYSQNRRLLGEEVDPRGWHLRQRIGFTVGMSLSSHEDKNNKTREEATTLLSN